MYIQANHKVKNLAMTCFLSDVELLIITESSLVLELLMTTVTRLIEQTKVLPERILNTITMPFLFLLQTNWIIQFAKNSSAAAQLAPSSVFAGIFLFARRSSVFVRALGRFHYNLRQPVVGRCLITRRRMAAGVREPGAFSSHSCFQPQFSAARHALSLAFRGASACVCVAFRFSLASRPLSTDDSYSSADQLFSTARQS